MKIGTSVNQNTHAYTQQAYTKQLESFAGNERNAKTGGSGGTLHIENARAAAEILSGYDVQNISPRDMADLSNKLYNKGIISQEENDVLGFQPELHPDYDAVIGLKTGTTAEPDTKRNYIEIWREKVAMFESIGNSKDAYNSGRILNILENLNSVNPQ